MMKLSQKREPDWKAEFVVYGFFSFLSGTILADAQRDSLTWVERILNPEYRFLV